MYVGDKSVAAALNSVRLRGCAAEVQSLLFAGDLPSRDSHCQCPQLLSCIESSVPAFRISLEVIKGLRAYLGVGNCNHRVDMQPLGQLR